MLTLILLRHAKSSWDHAQLSDFKRPLAKRGKKAAPEMGAELARLGLRPDLILCSGAARARETLALVLPELGSQSPPVVYDDALYMALPDGLLTGLHAIKPDHHGKSPQCVMMVGHNPGFEELALLLVGDGPAAELAELADKFPTAGAAVITFDAEHW
ncbi:MAG: SixA phosphatase family protein, partial [Hyphomicrobium sp.]